MIATDHSKIKVFNVIMVLALAFALVAGAIAVKTVTESTTAGAFNNVQPVAEAGLDQAIQQALNSDGTLGAYPTVTLDGSLSYDPDGGTLTYAWTTTTRNAAVYTIPSSTWVANTPYALGALVRPITDNGFDYVCTVAGTSGAVVPPWTTGIDDLVVDNTVTWTCVGRAFWPADGAGTVAFDDDTAVSPVVTFSGASVAGLYTFMLTVTDNGTNPGPLSKSDTLVVVVGKTFFVRLVGSDTMYNGTVYAVPSSGANGPWRTITHAIDSATVNNGDRIVVGPNTSSDTESGFGGSDPSAAENIVIDKWLKVWSLNGRDNNGSAYATTINVASQNNGISDINCAQVVKITWPSGGTEDEERVPIPGSQGINKEMTGVTLGCSGHGFNLQGAPVGVFAVGADASYIHQNRIREPKDNPGDPTGYNFVGIDVDYSIAPTIDDNIIVWAIQDDITDGAGSATGITLYYCDEFLPNLLRYNGSINVMGGAQVINNDIGLAQQNAVWGIMLYECPKAFVNGNNLAYPYDVSGNVGLSVKQSDDAESIGISLDYSECSVVSENIISVLVDATHSAWAIGISVADDSYEVDVLDNDIFVLGTGESPFALGGLLTIGISVVNSPYVEVLRNTVNVDAIATIARNGAGQYFVVSSGEGVRHLSTDELDALQKANDDIAAFRSPVVDLAGSLAMGVYAFNSDGIVIGKIDGVDGSGRPLIGTLGNGNDVDVDSNVTLQIVNMIEDDVRGGSALALGIAVLGWSMQGPYLLPMSDGAYVGFNNLLGFAGDPLDPCSLTGDTVGVHSNLIYNVTQTEYPIPGTPTPQPPLSVDIEGSGKSGAIGVLLFNCGIDYYDMPAMAVGNAIDVLGDGEVDLTALQVVLVESTADDWDSCVLGQLDESLEDIATNASLVASSPEIDLYNLNLSKNGFDLLDTDSYAEGRGFVYSIGVAAMESPAAVVAGNQITTATANLVANVISEVGTEEVLPLDDSAEANGHHCYTLALGILDYMCGLTLFPGQGVDVVTAVPTTVSQNYVQAFANSEVNVQAAQIVASYESADVEADGGGLAAGIGILVIGRDTIEQVYNYGPLSPGAPDDWDALPLAYKTATIIRNSVHGEGISNANIVSYNLVDEEKTEADGYAIGIGGGIVVISQAFPLISSNGDINGDGEPNYFGVGLGEEVFGYGEAGGDVGASGLAAEDPDTEVAAIAIGVGIAATFCTDPQIGVDFVDPLTGEMIPQGTGGNCNFHYFNYGAAAGDTELTPFAPREPFITGQAHAHGTANAINNVYITPVDEKFTEAEGFTEAVGVGILVSGCDGAVVTHNHAQGGQEDSTSNLVEDKDIPVSAEVDLMADENDPLERAVSEGFAVSLACGILLGDPEQFIPGDGDGNDDDYWHFMFCVNKSNNFEAGAFVDVDSQLEADCCGMPAYSLGLAAAIDAYIVYPGPEEPPHEGMHFHLEYVEYNYNDMPGILYITDMADGVGAVGVDLGMMIVNLDTSSQMISSLDSLERLLVDARYNYWGNPLNPVVYTADGLTNPELTGPGGIGFGVGQPLYIFALWFAAEVEWFPWLTINHEWCLDSHVGKFGKFIPLDKCWNSFSVPIALDDVSVDGHPYNTWEGFKALNTPGFTDAIGPAVYWDPLGGVPGPLGTMTGEWKTVLAGELLVPLKGYKVYVKYNTAALILASTRDTMPTLPVYEGWNLVGPNPPFCDIGMYVNDFVSSVVRTSGMDGFTQVVSQGSSQTNWSFTLGDWVLDDGWDLMIAGKAYWMYMNGSQMLSGFGFTRLPLYPEHTYFNN